MNKYKILGIVIVVGVIVMLTVIGAHGTITIGAER